MAKRSREPLVWAMFSSGGMLAALLFPALAAILWFGFPLGWTGMPSYADLVAKLGHPLVRLFVFFFVTVSLFHWGHRFRYTLYDGLQLHHLYILIAVCTYGVATMLTLLAAYLLLLFP